MSGRANRVFGPLLPFTDSTAVVYLSIPVKGSVFFFFSFFRSVADRVCSNSLLVEFLCTAYA